MRLLLDNNLSPRLAEVLSKAGGDAVHVATLGLRAAPDTVVMPTAPDDDRVLVSADTDVGALLAATRASRPAVVLVHRVVGRRVEALAALLLANLPDVDEDSRAGSVAVIGDDSLRVRRLPSADSRLFRYAQTPRKW